MDGKLRRRQFLQVAAGSAVCLGAGPMGSAAIAGGKPGIISPGARKSKVRVAKIYLGIPKALWPTPLMDVQAEMQVYEAEFAKRAKDFADIEFSVNQLATAPDQVKNLAEKVANVDGILVIHLSMGVMPILAEILNFKKPTVLFAAPYSGHEWTGFGGLRRQPGGELLECMLTSDYDQLAAAVRPFRAIHHMREAKILNVTSRDVLADYSKAIKEKFGTDIVTVGRDRMLAAYNAIEGSAAGSEAKQWISNARKVVEPSKEEIEKSCRLALAFEKLLDEENATMITVDCYGTMYRQLPAFPCIGFTRLNDMGLAGICESDLQSAMTFMLFQGLSGRPGFISDPTVDEKTRSIILAHCLGSTRMDGPEGEAAPYILRCIMERQEGAVAQVKMRVGQKVSQGILIGNDLIQYFTGEIIEAPDVDRGCRTKINVRVDGDIETLWQNWAHGLHRVTCYGDLIPDLRRFCRFKSIKLVNEAVAQVEAPAPPKKA